MLSERKNQMRIAIVGWGAIAQRVVELLLDRNENIVVAGIAARTRKSAGELPGGARWLSEPAALRDLAPDLVVEAAGRDAVEPWGMASLNCAPAFAVCSTSAFCDDALLQRLTNVAERCGSQILVPSGALGGLDALAAASRLPLDSVTHHIIKPPAAWRGTLAETLVDLDGLTKAQVFFEGSARAAATSFPANANVAALSALAGVGFERTFVQLIADPTIKQNCHHLVASGSFGSLSIKLENRPLLNNPRSSELAALSLVRLVESRARPVSI